MDNADACPFCASEALAYALLLPRGGYVYCARCHASGPRGRTQSEAVALWNRAARAPRQSDNYIAHETYLRRFWATQPAPPSFAELETK